MLGMNEDAFVMIFRNHDRRVYRLAYRFLGNREEAMDITQDVFVRAWKGFSGYDPARPAFPWLYSITRNLCINKIRRKSGNEAGLETPEYLPSAGLTEDEIIRKEEAVHIRAAVNSLPEMQREIIILKHFDDCSYEEISEILSIPKGTVMSRLFNARKMLKEALEVENEL